MNATAGVIAAGDDADGKPSDQKSENVNRAANQGQGDTSIRFNKFGKPRRARPCQPPNPSFDSGRYVEVFLHFDALRNFDTIDFPLPGQLVVRASCMGKTYGHFVSQSIDQLSQCNPDCSFPDVIIDEELVFYARFCDLIDNPILLSLLDTAGSSSVIYDELKPIGYICLDIPLIFGYEAGIVEGHVEPWVIPDANILNRFQQQPMIKLSLECQRGIPTKSQLRQGNIMTVCVESMSHLPDEIIRNVPNAKDRTDMNVMITLPHSDKEPILDFTSGRISDGTFIEPPLTLLRTLEESTQTKDALTNALESGRFVPTKHWANIPKHWKDIPIQATAISTALPPEIDDETSQLCGDAADIYENSVDYCQEPQIIWEALHKRYIPVEAYKKMLTRLSQDVIWPLEVAVTINKRDTSVSSREGLISSSQSSANHLHSSGSKKSKKRRHKEQTVEKPRAEESVATLNESRSGNEEDEEPEILYMNELGRPTSPETVLVYHGIAFVDLSRLVYPGVQKVRFACKLYPFSQKLLMSKTCLVNSAFSEVLDGVTLISGLSGDYNMTESVPGGIESGKSPDGVTDCSPFIVFEISLKRSIIPLYKTPTDLPEVVQDYIPAREIPRRKLVNSGIAQQKLRRAILEAAAEISSEFTNHYWKEIIQGGGESMLDKQQTPPPTSTETLKKGFVFYLNASGRYLVLREHLRQAVTLIVQQRCLNMRPSGFQSHRDFQSFLQDMYIYLIDEVHEALSRTSVPEIDPLEPIPNPPQGICNPEGPQSRIKLEQKELLRELLFYSEEAFAQGDFDNCHRLHLQRICRSKEDPNCWVDFAIMWLSRGDDRMAEIAVRESLRNDPNNIYALVIGGLIAIRHNDERGIDVLGAALGLKPLNPELLVIMGLAHASIGNEMGGDFFFRKAAYLHRDLTGKQTADIDKTFDLLSKSVGIKQSVQNIAKAQAALPKTSILPDVLKGGTSSSSNPGRNDKTNIEHKHISEGSTTSAHTHKKKRHRHGSTSSQVKNPEVHEGTDGIALGLAVENQDEEETVHIPEEEFYTRKTSISRGARKNSTYIPRFEFNSNIPIDNVMDSILPPLRPSMQIPWNITEFTDKLKGFLDVSDKINDRNRPLDSGIAPDEVIKAEYDKIINEEHKEKKHSKEKRKSLDVRTSQTGGHSGDASHPPRDNLHSAAGITSQKNSKQIIADGNENKPENDVKDVKKPVYVNRLGSELIWAGQLLLQLRMFDMLDGVLARELYVTAVRSIQFLYLRAMSLYFRQSYDEAIPVLDEAIQMDPDNAVLWSVRGHCFYELGQNAEALISYEKTLRLPVGKENRHLLYLRFGTLSLDTGNCDTAKRVFLHAIQKYPTPYMWLATGNTCFSMGEYDQAEAAFAEANRLDNTNAITWAHLALINLTLDQQALAEQSYKWALRFGLKKGKILDEIKRLQQEKGFGDPSFPRVPNCIPHDYYVRRLGRQKPFDIYRDALMNEPPTTGKRRFDDTEREKQLKQKLQLLAEKENLQNNPEKKLSESEKKENSSSATKQGIPVNNEPVPDLKPLVEEPSDNKPNKSAKGNGNKISGKAVAESHDTKNVSGRKSAERETGVRRRSSNIGKNPPANSGKKAADIATAKPVREGDQVKKEKKASKKNTPRKLEES